MRFKNFNLDKLKGRFSRGAAEESMPAVTQIDNLGEHFSSKTKELEATEQELKEL